MKIILYIVKAHFILIYFFIKLFTKQKKQVYLLSRQFDKPSINYQIIINELNKENIPYKIKCQKISTGVNDSIRTQGKYSNTLGFIKKILSNLKSSLNYYFSLYGQMISIASSKVIIVDGYNLPVSLLKHKKGTKVIQLWHSLGAIKKFGYQSIGKVDGINPTVANILKMHKGYDYVISGSKGMNKYFAEAFGVEESKVLAIGTPTVDYLKKKDQKIINKIYKKYPQLKTKINVLYSPTFRNDKKYNYEEIIENTDFSKVNLIITYHSKVDETINDNRVICINNKEFQTFDILKISDYIITDYSALAIDALIIQKKVLFFVYDFNEYNKNNGVNINLLKDYPSLSSKKGKTIMDIIHNNKYDTKTYNNLIKKFTPQTKTTSTEELMDLIRRLLNEKN